MRVLALISDNMQDTDMLRTEVNAVEDSGEMVYSTVLWGDLASGYLPCCLVQMIPSYQPLFLGQWQI